MVRVHFIHWLLTNTHTHSLSSTQHKDRPTKVVRKKIQIDGMTDCKRSVLVERNLHKLHFFQQTFSSYSNPTYRIFNPDEVLKKVRWLKTHFAFITSGESTSIRAKNVEKRKCIKSHYIEDTRECYFDHKANKN